jgi:hypothetical protein
VGDRGKGLWDSQLVIKVAGAEQEMQFTSLESR